MLLPQPDETSAPFWEAAFRGELRVQRCARCGVPRFPPRPMCAECHSTAVVWDRVSGRGRIWSFIVPHPPLLDAYAAQAPYNVVLVELVDVPAIRLVGNVVVRPDGPIGEVDPGSLRIGQEVAVVFDAPRDGIAMPRWVVEG